MSDSEHWVSKLFPPAFEYTLKELEEEEITSAKPPNEGSEKGHAESIPQDGVTSEKWKDDRKPQTPFELHLAHHIAPEDIPAIKNVYQRVWMMQKQSSTGRDPLQLTSGAHLSYVVLKCFQLF